MCQCSEYKREIKVVQIIPTTKRLKNLIEIKSRILSVAELLCFVKNMRVEEVMRW